MKTHSEIINKNGAPRLYINGKRADSLAYITYITDNNRYGDFTAAGYGLFSFPVFFGYNNLSEASGLPVFTKGIFDNEEPDFSIFDKDVERILKECPDAFIFPRVNVSLSHKWESAHPEELCEKRQADRPARASFASDLWAEEVKRELGIFIEHVEKSNFSKHIIGYQLACGNTEEWLPLVPAGINGKRAEEKYSLWLENNGAVRSEESFYRFYSELVASCITEFAAEIKKLTDRRLVVGTFYGYTFECPFRESGHHDLQRILECNDVDFICSPVSYTAARETGRDHPYMLPLGSIKLHNKLYFSENDTRTHLTKPLNDMPQYNSPTWFGPQFEKTCEIIKMHASRALINGHSAWWFDMWGGWYDDSRYMSLMQRILEIFRESNGRPSAQSETVAVFLDEKAFASADAETSVLIGSVTREALGKAGTQCSFYLTSDAEAVIDSCKAVISLVPIKTEASEHLSALAAKKKKPLIEITKENADITAQEIRKRLKDAGVCTLCEKDAVIYENESYIFLHTADDGEYTLNVPDGTVLTDVFSDEIFTNGAMLTKGKSILLRKD